MSNIIITGATGFIGENVANQFVAQGHTVHVCVRHSSNTDYLDRRINIFKTSATIDELSAYLKGNQIDVVIHIASKFLVDHKSCEVESLISSNVTFGVNLLEAMKIAGVTKFINTSSTWQHFEADNSQYVPTNLYAATKEAFCDIVDYYAEVANISAITLYIYDSYGKGDRRGKLVSMLEKLAKDKTELNMSAGEQEIGLTHIDDIVAAYSQAILEIDNNVGHNRYTIEPREIYSLRKVIDIFKETTGLDLNINWGAREYRQREVMKAWKKGVALPNWQAKVSLAQGFKDLFSKDK